MRHLFIGAILIAAPMVARGQVAAPHESFFALSVASVAESTRWYRDKLGFTLDREVPDRMALLHLGPVSLELVHAQGSVPLRTALPAASDAMAVHGIAKVGWVVDDFDGTVTRLRAKGVDIAFGPFPKRSDQRANVIIRDNAGNMIQLFGR